MFIEMTPIINTTASGVAGMSQCWSRSGPESGMFLASCVPVHNECKYDVLATVVLPMLRNPGIATVAVS